MTPRITYLTDDGMSMLFGGMWLVFLLFPLAAQVQRGQWQDWTAFVVFLAFAGYYLDSLRRFGQIVRFDPTLRGRAQFDVGVLVLMFVGAVLLVGSEASYMLPYVVVIASSLAPPWASVVLALGVCLVQVTATFTLDWPRGTMWSCASIFLVGLSMLPARHGIENDALERQRMDSEARLALDRQRLDIARDLHDILGHSLTVIAVKAELAGKLLDRNPAAAREHIGEVEALARDALADVRATVTGYRALTLPGEIARATQALTDAGVTPLMPGATEHVPSHLRECFAWAIREAVTNVVRHAGAKTCEVTLTATSVTIRDDGVGLPAEHRHGNGLAGLAERAATAGTQLLVTSEPRHGTTLTLVEGDPA